jgi:hypothetical protein
MPAVKGLFLVPPPEFELMLYYGSDGSLPVLHDGVVVAPSGHYTARAEDHSLLLFRAIDDSYSGDPYDQIAGCDSVLSWAPFTERIACARQIADADDRLLIFDVNQATDKLSLFSDVPLQVPFPDSAHIERRRLFSRSGAHFAFSSDDTLSVVSLAGAAPEADFNIALLSAGLAPNNAFAELLFSPNELMLLQHRGSRLSFFDLLNQGLGEVRLSDSLAASVACKEDFQNQQVGWCGVERPQAPFSWAPASDLAVFLDANGALQIYDFTGRQQGLYSLIAVHDQCTQDCLVDGQFAFQP